MDRAPIDRGGATVEQRRTTCNRDCPDACSIIATVESTGSSGDAGAGDAGDAGGHARSDAGGDAGGAGGASTAHGWRVTRLAGDPDHPVTRGFLCYRTNHFL